MCKSPYNYIIFTAELFQAYLFSLTYAVNRHFQYKTFYNQDLFQRTMCLRDCCVGHKFTTCFYVEAVDCDWKRENAV